MTPRRCRNRVTTCAASAVLLTLQTPGVAAAGSVALPDGFSFQPIASGVENPTGFAFLPDGRVLVAEQKQPPPSDGQGFVYLLVGPHVVGPILTIADVATGGGEQGLLGVAVDPEWPTRPYVYVHFSHSTSANVVRRYTATGDLDAFGSMNLSLGDPFDVIDDLPNSTGLHNGGTLRFGPDGMLYVSHGDDATDTCAELQDPDTWLGVVLRLDVSSLPAGPGGPPSKADLIPAGNPFPGPGESAQLTFCIGLRNPFRFTIDSLTGTLYIGDVGETGWEELDEASAGDNFGWPLREGAHDFAPGAGCPGSIGEDPIAEYPHAAGPAAIVPGPRYRDGGAPFGFGPAYDGDLFYMDFYDGWLRRLTWNGAIWEPAASVPGQPSAVDWGTGLAFVSDMQQGPDGAIYLVRRFAETFFARIVADPIVAVEPGAPVASRPRLSVVPRPLAANGIGALRFDLESSGVVDLALFDVAGRRILTIHEGPLAAGRHDLTWRALALSPGVYFLRLETPSGVDVARLPVLR